MAQCAPTFDESDSLVVGPRVLAVVAEPAEAKPGSVVMFRALVVGPGGTASNPTIDWGFCTAPKPLTTDNVVSNACLSAASIVPAGNGGGIVATTPANGCELFGPDLAPGGGRPRDPDATGGYYQPLEVALQGAEVAFALVRITCDLSGASAATATAFAQSYTPNENPTLLPVVSIAGGVPAPLSSTRPGATIALEASWPAASAETYAYFEATTDSIAFQRESLTVSWYTTAGAFATESTGRAADDLATTSSNTWTAPTSEGVAHLWIVIRDSRGGADFASYDVVVAGGASP